MRQRRTIRELRQEAGFSQFQLAVKVGVTPLTIAKWETNRTEPKALSLRRVAEVFGVSMDDIEIPDPQEDAKKAAA